MHSQRTSARSVGSNTIFLVLLALLTCSFLSVPPVLAVSKSSIPQIESEDFRFFFTDRDETEEDKVYLYFSYSLIDLEGDSLEFVLTRSRSAQLTPIGAVPIFPPIESRIRSEYIDISIWGHLGNYFNKNIEALEIENDINSILCELEEINERYGALAGTARRQPLKTEYLKTIYTDNYYVRPESTAAPAPRKEPSNQGEPRDKILLRYRDDPLPERIKPSIVETQLLEEDESDIPHEETIAYDASEMLEDDSIFLIDSSTLIRSGPSSAGLMGSFINSLFDLFDLALEYKFIVLFLMVLVVPLVSIANLKAGRKRR